MAKSLPPPPKLQKLQTALHAKAKESPNFRFYALYDKVYRRDVLEAAYAAMPCQRRRAGRGRPDVRGHRGVRSGPVVGRTDGGIANETYQPQPVRRVYLPKPDGKQRPLGIPTIRDRVVQSRRLLVLEPIFEADLQPEQYAYRPEPQRPGGGAGGATVGPRQGYRAVVDADLSGYFDSIPHAELMLCVARRVSDQAMLHLIKQWLVAPVEETDERGHRHVPRGTRNEGRGTPQGAPISPLLANLYMRRFVMGWKTLGHETRYQARIVNYADDFVICCRGPADDAMAAMRGMMRKLKLTVNETKTHVCRLPAESFDFLGYTFGRMYSPRTGGAYIGPSPSRKLIQRFCREISELTERRWASRQVGFGRRAQQEVEGLGELLLTGTCNTAYRLVDNHVRYRLRRWLKAKYKVRGPGRHDSRRATCMKTWGCTACKDGPDALRVRRGE